jgi:hypothetical protein
MAWNTEGGPDGAADPGPAPPVTPHAAPSLDGEGQLTYVGVDGRRYVVGLPPELDPASLERVMGTLQRGGSLFHQIEGLARRWIAQVSGPDLDARAALLLLVTTLETSLEELFPEDGPPAER